MLKRHKVVMPLATELGLVAQWQGNSRELAQELAAAGVHLPVLAALSILRSIQAKFAVW